MEKVFEQAFRRQKSILLIGNSGIGKSERVYAWAEEKARQLKREFLLWHKLREVEKQEILSEVHKYFVLVDIKLQSVGDPSKLTGIPVIVNHNGNTKIIWQPPLFVKLFTQDNSAGVFFLDEINMALPSLQSSAFCAHYRCWKSAISEHFGKRSTKTTT